MQDVLSREQVRALDAYAMTSAAVPGVVLMENAGRGAADIVERRLESRPGPVCIVCGAGNNGGDGFVVARQLLSRGRDVRVFFAADRQSLTGDALVNHDAFAGVGGVVWPLADGDFGVLDAALSEAAIVVDALLGTGLSRDVAGLYRDVIERVNGAPGLRIALDVPSGLDANTGQALGACVRADETITFAATKLGLVTSAGAALAGAVTVKDIGVPRSLVRAVGASARIAEKGDIASYVKRRGLAAHKGTAGRLVAVAGSAGKTGAALLVARGALRAGAGTVTIATFPAAADALDHRVLEEMTARIDPAAVETSLDALLRGADAVVLGPGLGLDAEARRVVEHVVLTHGGTVVVDADALTHLAGKLGAVRNARGARILTPHPGEMARLLGVTAGDVERDRFAAVKRAAEASGAVVLLKGARTLIAKEGELPVVNPTGGPALATAGSGDVLGGVIAALSVAAPGPFEAACAGAYVHGRAEESWSEGAARDRGLLAHEIADQVPGVLAWLTTSTAGLPV